MANFLTRALQSSLRRKIGASLNFIRQCSTEIDATASLSSTMKFIPQLSRIDNNWIYQKNEDIRTPLNHGYKIEIPKNLIIPFIEDPGDKSVIETPPEKNDITIEAARLIVIRRRKMKTHKLKKLRKKLKFVRAKIRQKRELKKEKEFQEVLIQQCKQAESFSAEEYVESRLQKYQEALNYAPKVKKTYYD